MTAPTVDTTVRLEYDVHVRASLFPMRRGPGDPTQLHANDGAVWRTTCFDSGPVAYRLWQPDLRTVHVSCWGAGSEEFMHTLPGLLGRDDRPQDFDPRTERVATLWRKAPPFRVPASLRVLDALVPGVIEQRVTGKEAFRAFGYLVRYVGKMCDAPSPRPMLYPPTAEEWLDIPTWEWHASGVDPGRMRATRRALRFADELEYAAARGNHAKVRGLLRQIPGIGDWTIAQVAHRALGDADAIPWWDYHLGRTVGWVLTGAAVELDEVAPLVAQWTPQRYRLLRLLESAPQSVPPRRGPKITIQDHRRH